MMCPPCVIWTTHIAVMCVLHVIQNLSVQTCVSAGVWELCVFDRFSVLWGSELFFFVFFLHQSDMKKSPFGFDFCVGCRRRSPVLDKYHFFVVVLEWGVKLLWRRSAFVFEVQSGSLVSFCVVSFSSAEILLCPLCGPKVLRNPTQCCHFKFSWRLLRCECLISIFKVTLVPRMSMFCLSFECISIHLFACLWKSFLDVA